METLTKVQEEVKKLFKFPKKESKEANAEQEIKLVATDLRFAEANVGYGSAIGACYDLFCQLLAEEPQVQWERIIVDVHNKDPWIGLDGVKHKGICTHKPSQNFKWICSLVTNAQRQRVNSCFHQEGEHCIQ